MSSEYKLRRPSLVKKCSKCTWILPVSLVLIAVVVGLIIWRVISTKKKSTGAELEMIPVDALQNSDQVVQHADKIASGLKKIKSEDEYPHMQQNPYARTQREGRDQYDSQNRYNQHIDQGPVSAFGHSGAMQYSNDMFETAHIRGPDDPQAYHSGPGHTPIDRSFAKPAQSQAQQLNAQQFQDAIRKSSCVVAFMSTGCGHCEHMKPNFHEAAAMARLPFYFVDAASDPQPAAQYGIQGFPTVLRFEKGEPAQEYNGDRSVESLAAFGSN